MTLANLKVECLQQCYMLALKRVNEPTQAGKHSQDTPETVSSPPIADQRRQDPFHPKIQFWDYVNILGHDVRWCAYGICTAWLNQSTAFDLKLSDRTVTLILFQSSLCFRGNSMSDCMQLPLSCVSKAIGRATPSWYLPWNTRFHVDPTMPTSKRKWRRTLNFGFEPCSWLLEEAKTGR